ncbi:MAG: PepSY domain-containing protein [Rhizobiaceae bacterium]
MKTILFSTAAFFISLGAANAADICKAYDKAEWMTEEAITAKVTELGYAVSGLKAEDGCWEVKGKKDGALVEAYFDPKTAELVLTK